MNKGNGYSAAQMLRNIVHDNISKELKKPLSDLLGFEVFIYHGSLFADNVWAKLEEQACRRLGIEYADYKRETQPKDVK